MLVTLFFGWLYASDYPKGGIFMASDFSSILDKERYASSFVISIFNIKFCVKNVDGEKLFWGIQSRSSWT